MPDDNNFTIKDYERIIDDIIDEYFDQHNINYDMKELVKSGMLSRDTIPGARTIEEINAITQNTNI